jgi:hypothetical protein
LAIIQNDVEVAEVSKFHTEYDHNNFPNPPEIYPGFFTTVYFFTKAG